MWIIFLLLIMNFIYIICLLYIHYLILLCKKNILQLYFQYTNFNKYIYISNVNYEI